MSGAVSGDSIPYQTLYSVSQTRTRGVAFSTGALSIRRDAALPWCTQFMRGNGRQNRPMQVSRNSHGRLNRIHCPDTGRFSTDRRLCTKYLVIQIHAVTRL